MAWWAIAGYVVSAALSYLGSKKQSDALKNASAGQTAIQQQYLQMYKDMMAEGAFERGVASASRIRAMQKLGDELLRPVGTSPEFRAASKEGMETLASQYGNLGLVSGPGGSSAFGKASGKFMSNLIAKDYRLKMDKLTTLAELGPKSSTPGQAVGMLDRAAGAGTNIANIGLQQGQLTSDLYGGLAGYAGEAIKNVDWGGLKDWFSNDYSTGQSIGVADTG